MIKDRSNRKRLIKVVMTEKRMIKDRSNITEERSKNESLVSEFVWRERGSPKNGL